MPRFGKDKDARKEELDRQAAEEVERLTRRAGPPGMGGGMVGPGGAPRIGIPSPLEQIADELRDAPPPSMRRIPSARRNAPQPPQQAFTPMPSGAVGSSFGPGGLNPGPRTGAMAPPPSAFGGAGYDEDYGGPVTGPPVYYAEPDEEEEMTITELALMDHAARTGHNPEDLVMQYDATSAEDMRDRAMRQFYERQQARPGGPQTNNPFAPAGMRGGPAGPAARRSDDPAAAGGALAQRLANRRRREEEEARRSGLPAGARDSSATAALARNKPKVASTTAAGATKPELAEDEGALAKLLARRRQSLGVDAQDEPGPAPGPRHAAERAATSPAMRAVPPEPELEDDQEEEAAPAPVRKATARKAPPAAKKPAPAAKKAPAATRAPAKKATPAAKKATPATKKAGKAGATVAEAPAPAAKKKPAPAAKKAAKSGAKSVFCIECGEKNPAIAKFCFNCGNRLAVPED
ncbi:MAG TPA: hypothetical protein VL337_06470 [Acidimicrobiales bacterium]|nr:hypothetical protein [Acidimicrobiales bacterium]